MPEASHESSRPLPPIEVEPTSNGVAGREAAPSDQELMHQLQARQESALEALYDRYACPVYSLCLRVLRRPADAEEVMLEVFWEIWRTPERFDHRRGGVGSYLLMMARSRAIDRFRSRSARPDHADGMTESGTTRSDPSDPAQPDPSSGLKLRERGERMRRALGGLSDVQREAIELAYFEGLSHTRIAERLGEPVGTIKTRIRQGVIHLREHLQGQEGELL